MLWILFSNPVLFIDTFQPQSDIFMSNKSNLNNTKTIQYYINNIFWCAMGDNFIFNLWYIFSANYRDWGGGSFADQAILPQVKINPLKFCNINPLLRLLHPWISIFTTLNYILVLVCWTFLTCLNNIDFFYQLCTIPEWCNNFW